MIGNKCLLDTSIIIHAFKSNNKIVEKLNEMNEIYVSATVIGELYFGAFRSGKAEKHLTQINSFLANCIILPVNINTAEIYGKIKSALLQKGKPIPENDIWIAASSLQYELPIFTTDAHFKEIEEINLI